MSQQPNPLSDIHESATPLSHGYSGLFRMASERYFGSYGVSKSMLDDLAQSPGHLQYRQQHPEAETEAMRIGHWTHLAVFEPEVFSNTVMMTELERRGTKEWKLVEDIAASSGRTVVKKPEYDKIVGISEAVRTHRVCSQLLKRGVAEVSAFAQEPDLGLQLRSRIDWIPWSGDCIADLKTTESASHSEFQRSVANFRYHVQASYYLDLLARIGIYREYFLFIVVEKDPPHFVQVFQLDEPAIQAGRALYMAGLSKYAECLATDTWPAYSEEVEMLSLPAWAYPKLLA